MTRVKECVLYRGFEYGDILDKMTALIIICCHILFITD